MKSLTSIPKSRGMPPSACSVTLNLWKIQKRQPLRSLALRTRCHYGVLIVTNKPMTYFVIENQVQNNFVVENWVQNQPCDYFHYRFRINLVIENWVISMLWLKIKLKINLVIVRSRFWCSGINGFYNRFHPLTEIDHKSDFEVSLQPHRFFCSIWYSIII